MGDRRSGRAGGMGGHEEREGKRSGRAGGVGGHCTILQVGMVAGGRKPKFADNAVMVYDDAAEKMVASPVSCSFSSSWSSLPS